MSTKNGTTRRGYWYLLAGLLIGLALGLLYSWVISPIRYVDTAPVSLRADFKDQYRAMIASAYLATGDLGRAQARLALLGDPDPIQALTLQAQRDLADGSPGESAHALAVLAAALKQPPTLNPPYPTPLIITPATMAPTGTPATLTPTRPPTTTPTPIYSPTPRPTRTPTPTVGAPFALIVQDTLCDAALPESLLQVEVYNAVGRPVAGAEIVITWNGYEEHIFTGLKPELGDGYADFLMSPGVTYVLQLAAGGAPVPDLSVPACQAGSGDSFWGGLRLVFRQP